MVQRKFTGIQHGPKNITVRLTGLRIMIVDVAGEALLFRRRRVAGQRRQVKPVNDLCRGLGVFQCLIQKSRAAGKLRRIH